MMKACRSFLTTLLVLLFAAPPASAITVGLSSDSVNSIYVEQKQSAWCWAACIQMVANLYGADLTQDEVVARTYGPGVNRAGTLDVITANLNGSGTTPNGRSYTITSQMLTNRQLPAALVAELSAGHPVMLGCDAGGSGHAVVCTAISYEGDASDPSITVLTVRDPWPSASNRAGSGRQTLRGSDLGPRIMEGWIIHIAVHEANGSVVPPPQGYVLNDTNATPDDSPALVPSPFPSVRPHQPLVANNNRRPARRDDDDDSADNILHPTRHPLVEAVADVMDQMQAFLTTR